MKTFLNLNISVINKLHITEICKRHPGTYTIYMNPHNSQGFFLFGFGLFTSEYQKIKICKKDNPNDYNKITDWIHSREDN